MNGHPKVVSHKGFQVGSFVVGRALLEARERFWGGYRPVFLVGFVAWSTALALAFLQGRLVDPAGQLAAGASAVALAVAAVLALPRRRLVVMPHSVEVTGAMRPCLLTTQGIRGLSWSRFLPASAGFARAASLVAETGSLRFADFEDADRVWTVVRERLLPQVAERLAAAVARGEAITVGVSKFDWNRVEILGHRVGWPEVDELVELGGGRWMLGFTGRPADAVVVDARECPDAPLLASLLARSPGNREPARPGESRWPVALAKRFRPVAPLPGLPATHPELGRLLYTFDPSAGIGASPRMLGAAILLLGLAVGLGGLGLGTRVALASLGLGMAGVALLGGRTATRSRGDAFCLYEKGIANQAGGFRWLEVVSVAAGSLGRYRVSLRSALVGRATGTAPSLAVGRVASLAIACPDRTLEAASAEPGFEAACRLVERAVAPILAGRALERIQMGLSVELGGASVSLAGIVAPDGTRLPWDRYAGHRSVSSQVVVTPGKGGLDLGMEYAEVPALEVLVRDRSRPAFTLGFDQPDAPVLRSLLAGLERAGITRHRPSQPPVVSAQPPVPAKERPVSAQAPTVASAPGYGAGASPSTPGSGIRPSRNTAPGLRAVGPTAGSAGSVPRTLSGGPTRATGPLPQVAYSDPGSGAQGRPGSGARPATGSQPRAARAPSGAAPADNSTRIASRNRLR